MVSRPSYKFAVPLPCPATGPYPAERADLENSAFFEIREVALQVYKLRPEEAPSRDAAKRRDPVKGTAAKRRESDLAPP